MMSLFTRGQLRLLIFALHVHILISSVSTFPTGTSESDTTTISWTEIEVTELPEVFDSGTEVDVITITEREEQNDFISEPTTLRPNIDYENVKEEYTTSVYIHQDQEEIMNELRNIWHYSENLDDDQNDLKRSLSSLVHMTYARVYELEPDETLTRLKYLLRKLRSKLLQQVEDSTSVDLLVTTTTEIPLAPFPDLEKNTTVTQGLLVRKKRNYESKLEPMNIKLLDANSDENSLFSDSNEIFYKRLAELKRNHSLALSKESNSENTNTIAQKVIPIEDRISQKVSADKSDEDEGETTQMPFQETYSTKNTLKDLTTTSTTTASTMFEKLNLIDNIINKNGGKPTEIESYPVPSTVDDIVQSIIAVLQSPAKYQAFKYTTPKTTFNRPYPTMSVHLYQPKPLDKINNNNTGINSQTNQNQTGYHDLPSYLSNLFAVSSQSNELQKKNMTADIFADSVSDEGSKDFNITKTTETSTLLSSTPSISAVMAEEVATEILSSPTQMMNQTMERIILFMSVFTNLSNASRMVLMFAVAISILSIALGLYSLGPPMVAVGVLGIIVPVLLLLLFQGGRMKRLKSVKNDILESINMDEMIDILQQIADAFEKYNN